MKFKVAVVPEFYQLKIENFDIEVLPKSINLSYNIDINYSSIGIDNIFVSIPDQVIKTYVELQPDKGDVIILDLIINLEGCTVNDKIEHTHLSYSLIPTLIEIHCDSIQMNKNEIIVSATGIVNF